MDVLITDEFTETEHCGNVQRPLAVQGQVTDILLESGSKRAPVPSRAGTAHVVTEPLARKPIGKIHRHSLGPAEIERVHHLHDPQSCALAHWISGTSCPGSISES